MATERLSMRNTREILRQKWTLGRSHREVGQAVGVSIGAVSGAIARAIAAGLDWPAVQALADDALEAKLYPSVAAASDRPTPDCAYIHVERRKTGVTLELLHLEYLEKHPNGYRYTQFCEHYREWLDKRRLTMRQEHRAGEKLFVDYSGKKPHIVDPKTGEVIEVELFVAVLGASNYTYAEATLTQRGPDFIASHVRALAFLGGVPAALVPDQLKSGVVVACRYEPGIQRTYEELGAALRDRDPAGAPGAAARQGEGRGRRADRAALDPGAAAPRDLLLARRAERADRRAARGAERAADARLRREPARALRAARPAGAEAAAGRALRVRRVAQGARQHRLPRRGRPPLLLGAARARARAGRGAVHRDDRRALPQGRARRLSPAQLPARGAHDHRRAHAEGAPRARGVDAVAHRRLGGDDRAEHDGARRGDPRRAPHPEQGYRSCLGILRLGKQYGNERLEAACARALAVRARSYRHVESILKNSLDRIPVPAKPPAAGPPVDHENIRGRDYYN